MSLCFDLFTIRLCIVFGGVTKGINTQIYQELKGHDSPKLTSVFCTTIGVVVAMTGLCDASCCVFITVLLMYLMIGYFVK